MKALGEFLPELKVNHSGQEKPSLREPLSSDFEGRKRLSNLLAMCYDSLNLFGKEPEQLVATTRLFHMILADYSIEVVEDAFKKYMKIHTNMPAPADIVNIIEPPAPKIEWPVYIELKRRIREGRSYVTPEEKEFIRNCEDLAITRQKGEMEEYQKAQKQLSAPNTQLIEYSEE